MPRFARVVVPGCSHHITHRGNRRDDVFFSDEDSHRCARPVLGCLAHLDGR